MNSENTDHLTRRAQSKITTPHKEQEGLMFVKARQQHRHCVFSELSYCLIECITGLGLQKQPRVCKRREASTEQKPVLKYSVLTKTISPFCCSPAILKQGAGSQLLID